jgi:hypothetical protein
MCRVIILVLQDSCTIYYGLWPPDNTNCSLSNMVLEPKLGFRTLATSVSRSFFFFVSSLRRLIDLRHGCAVSPCRF